MGERELWELAMSDAKLEIYDALELALKELLAKGLMRNDEYRLTASRVGREWVFWFVFLPEVFGADVTVFVTDEKETRTQVGI